MADPIKSRIIKTEDVPWKSIQILQPKKFKEQLEIDKEKLVNSFLNNGIIGVVYVWQDPDGILWCLDGKHRIDTLIELESRGHTPPEMIPATFVGCANKKEAAKVVLIYSSAYASVTNSSFIDFINGFDLEFSFLKDEASIPGVDFAEIDFLLNPVGEELIRNKKDKPNTLRITFVDYKQMEKAQKEIEQLLTKYEGAIYSVSSGEI